LKTQQFGPKAHQAIEARQLVRDSDPNFETSLVELFAGTHVAHPQVIAVLDAHGRGWSDSLTRDNCEMSMSQGPEKAIGRLVHADDFDCRGFGVIKQIAAHNLTYRRSDSLFRVPNQIVSRHWIAPKHRKQ
jgi:hypothetical protein